MPANGTTTEIAGWFDEAGDLATAEADALADIIPLDCYRDQYEAWYAAV